MTRRTVLLVVGAVLVYLPCFTSSLPARSSASCFVGGCPLFDVCKSKAARGRLPISPALGPSTVSGTTMMMRLPSVVKTAKAAFLAIMISSSLFSRTVKAAGDDGFMMGSDGTMLMERKPSSLSWMKTEIMAAGGATAVSFGIAATVAINRERKMALADVEELEKDMARFNSFKEEFLEGGLSDRSLYTSLKKVTRTQKDDQFEHNFQLFMEEEEARQDTKNKKKEAKHKESSMMERSRDKGDDSRQAYSNEISPAVSDDSVRNRLEKIFGGDDGSPVK